MRRRGRLRITLTSALLLVVARAIKVGSCPQIGIITDTQEKPGKCPAISILDLQTTTIIFFYHIIYSYIFLQ